MRQRPQSWRITVFVGSAMALGAALGLLFGLMLLGNAAVGPLAGAVIGAVSGLIYEVQSRKEQNG